MLIRPSFLFLTGILASLISTEIAADVQILLGARATAVERHAAEELKTDIANVYRDEKVQIRIFRADEKPGANDHFILLGRRDSHEFFSGPDVSTTFPLVEEALGPETFVLQSSSSEKNLFAIVGADDRGVLYGVYEFSNQVLGINALEYWTGIAPPPRQNFSIPEIAYVEQAPVFKLRGYFDNDNDHLANWSGRKLIVEFDTWKEMIDSLARLRFNYIDIHDLLGRPEYYLRDYYKQMTDYHTDMELVDQVIDYAHSKGLLVQIPMALGWEFKHLAMDEVCLTEHHDKWMTLYRYYLSETPLGKSDLFLARPRHPIYDWGYSCPAEEQRGIEPGPLLEALFSDLVQLIEDHNPQARLIADLWQEGRALWVDGGFAPDKGIQMLWADNGFADFEGWPTDQQGYPMGVYIHAGVWHNQVVQDPYPKLIGQSLREAANRGMTHNGLVNGQGFKPFILNLEAAALALWNPHAFDPEQYYLDWTTRYFGRRASAGAVQSFRHLHSAHADIRGFRDVTKAQHKIMRNLVQGKMLPVDLEPASQALDASRKALSLAQDTLALVPADRIEVFDDQLLFPVRLYTQNLELLESLGELNNAVVSKSDISGHARATRKRLQTLRTSLEKGSRWKKWAGWYSPAHFRIHTPPVDPEVLEALIISLTP